MKPFALAALAGVSLWLATPVSFATDAPGQDAGGINAPEQRDKPYVVLVSVDGMRWDFPDLYPTPNLRRLIADGTRAERLLPVWPTLTFPNHFTLVTGLSPSRHGLVANEFPDPALGSWYRIRDRGTVMDGRYYHGEPIWVTAERQGMVSAAYFWVGTEAAVKGVQPSHWRLYDKQVTGGARVEQALQWLALPAEQRPHLVLLYFETLDDQAHWNGIGSEGFLGAMQQVDGWLGRLRSGIAALPHGDRVNLVVVSDHGQMAYRDEPPFVLAEHIPMDGLVVVDGGPYVLAWLEHPDPARAEALAARVNRTWRHGRAWTRETAPPQWRLADSPRHPHLVFVAEAGHAVLSTEAMSSKITPGDHGWAPEVPEMHGVFIAAGPGIRNGETIGPVPAQDVHAMLLSLLGLQAPEDPMDCGTDALAALRQASH